MVKLQELLARVSEPAKDLRINLQNVLTDSSLSAEQRVGVAIACAYAARAPELAQALIQEHGERVGPAWVEDAQAAAALMGMNNIFYRFRHLVGRETYSSLPARLRMTRMANPKTSKLDFELMSLAVSAIGGCGTCVESHEKAVLGHGLSETQVLDAVRIAAVVQGLAVALTMGEAPAAV
jgi:lipoyl-dependent peroxiredoxin subunit D